jgi:hypothetical protein
MRRLRALHVVAKVAASSYNNSGSQQQIHCGVDAGHDRHLP